MESRPHYILVGAFVLAMLFAVGVAILWLIGAQFSHRFKTYDIYFNGPVTGLSDGAPVRYNGIQVGRVADIRLDPENLERIRVRVEIQSTLPIKKDAVASLELQGITGQSFIQILGGSNSSPVLTPPPDKRFPIIASRPSQLEQVVMSVPDLLRQTTQAADRFALVLNDQNVKALGETLRNLAAVSGTLADRRVEMSRLIDDTAGTMADVRKAADGASAVLGRLDASLGAQGIDGKLTDAIQEFGQAARNLNQMTTHIDTLIEENRGALSAFSRTGLTQAEQLVVDARALVAELTRIADQIERDPPRFFFGDRREGYQPR